LGLLSISRAEKKEIESISASSVTLSLFSPEFSSQLFPILAFQWYFFADGWLENLSSCEKLLLGFSGALTFLHALLR